MSRIIVFGSVGEGKSSLINLLAGEDLQRAGADVAGVTFDFSDCAVTSPNGDKYVFIDTVGLDESNAGKVNGVLALLKLKELLTLATSEGFALALMVHQGARLTTSSFAQNYKVFVEKLLQPANIPVVLVKTGLDQEEDWENDWYHAKTTDGQENSDIISALYPGFTRVYGGTSQAIRNRNAAYAAFVEAQRQKTRDGLWKVIEETKLGANKTIPRDKLREFFIQVWNGLCDGMEVLCEKSADIEQFVNRGKPSVARAAAKFWRLAKVIPGQAQNFMAWWKGVMDAGAKAWQTHGPQWGPSDGGDAPYNDTDDMFNTWWGL